MARRFRQRIGAVMHWTVAQGSREDNPAGEAIRAALPTNRVRPRHPAALPHAEGAGAVEQARDSGAYPATVLALRSGPERDPANRRGGGITRR